MPQTDFLHLFPLSKKDFIIDGFQKMNISMLEVALDDDKLYQDHTKTAFLKKVAKDFEKLKKNGNTELKAYKGICTTNNCPNNGCKGYPFVGNKLMDAVDFVFEETTDDFKDIYTCYGMRSEAAIRAKNYFRQPLKTKN